MGQGFCLVAPRLRERCEFGGGSKLGEMFFYGSEIVPLFARPIPPPLKDYGGGRAGADNESPSTSGSGSTGASEEEGAKQQAQAKPPQLSTLPTEIHRLIFRFLHIEDVFHLGLTSLHFWSIAKSVILAYNCSLLGRWAGTPTACVGDETCTYPPGLLTSEDKDEMQRGWTPDELTYLCPSSADHPEPVGLTALASLRYQPVGSGLPGASNISPAYDRYMLQMCILNVHWRRRIEPVVEELSRVVKPPMSAFYPDDRSWLLRNLTTREFVTAEAIAPRADFIRGPFIAELGFGDAILARVSWSTCRSVAMAYEGGIHQGVWAGHSLDIVPADQIGPDDNSWTDVSDAVAKELAAICEREMGEDWRDQMIESYESSLRAGRDPFL